jgi:hypothetical protein
MMVFTDVFPRPQDTRLQLSSHSQQQLYQGIMPAANSISLRASPL